MKNRYQYFLLIPLLSAGLSIPALPVQAQESAQKSSNDLQSALRRIARNSKDSSALADAGLAALELGDTRAAIGFLARADEIYPKSGRVKAGLARALLAEENPFGALRYFNQALENGISIRDIASDRGLAFDLIGRNREAQKDYELALQGDQSDELISRYAVSLGISGDLDLADAQLNPLLQKSDRDAWRNRAFILAMNGRNKDANAIAEQTMPRRLSAAIKPFFNRMPKLTAAQKAAAVHLGHFPASENIGVDVAAVQFASTLAVRGGDGADAGLIPIGEPLGAEVERPRVLAMPDKSERRRPGQSSKSRSKKPVEIVVLEESSLPSSRGARKKNSRSVAVDSREGQRLLRKAAREGSAEAQAYLDSQNRAEEPAPIQESPVKIAQTETPNAQPIVDEPPALNPSSTAVPRQVAEKTNASPGFETLTGEKGQDSKSAIEIARVENRPTGLVSALVERKVAIGDVPPPQSKPAESKAPNIASADAVQTNKPVQLASFDLANTVSSSAPKPVQTAQVNDERRPLSEIMQSISVPDTERKTDVVPVDLDSIESAKEKKSAEPKPEPVKKEPEHPKRYWVQIATGANKVALKYDYRRMARKHGDLFNGKSGWTSPWGRTRRLVVGPFDGLKTAKSFESQFRKGGGDGFAWVSAQGTEVNKLTQ